MRWRAGAEGRGKLASAGAALAIALCIALPARAEGGKPDKTDEKTGQTEKTDKPVVSPGVKKARFNRSVFKPDPHYPATFSPTQQIEIYGGKKKIDEPRPLVELGQKLYVEGPLEPAQNLVGPKNLVTPAFSLYGDWRSAVAYNDNGPGKRVGLVATRFNLEVDLELTATERFHALFRPLDNNGQFTRFEFFGPDAKGFRFESDPTPRTFFFEGDVGNIVAGFSDRYQAYDLPFAVGLTPLIFQNGIWVNSALAGAAVTLPGRNSAALNISNMDITFFAGGDQVTTPAVKDAQGLLVKHGLSVFGANAFIEANQGYWEVGLGYLDDFRGQQFDASYGSATAAFTRRYGGWLSNSIRGIWTFGQRPQAKGQRTADGFIVLLENSLISSRELVLVPYLNMFAGFGHPQSLLRNADAGGILFNSGILFEVDGLTGFPKLDDTAQDTYGAALGVNYLFNLDQQIVLEAATVQPVNGKFDPNRPAKAAQYGFGARYQRNLSRSLIFRADAMYAVREHDANIAGVRTEIRWKF